MNLIWFEIQSAAYSKVFTSYFIKCRKTYTQCACIAHQQRNINNPLVKSKWIVTLFPKLVKNLYVMNLINALYHQIDELPTAHFPYVYALYLHLYTICVWKLPMIFVEWFNLNPKLKNRFYQFVIDFEIDFRNKKLPQFAYASMNLCRNKR